MTIVSNSTRGVKLTVEGIRDLILGEDVCRRSVGEAFNILLSIKDIGKEFNKRGWGSR